MQEMPKDLAIRNFSRALKGCMNDAVAEKIKEQNFYQLTQKEVSRAIWMAATEYAAYEDKHYGHSKD